MDKELNSSLDCNSPNIKDSDNEQSIVGKFKSIINSTPLSKWFRKRDDEDTVLPPSKKFKPPTDTRDISYELSFDPPSRPPVNSEIVGSNNKFSCFPEPLAGPSGIKHRKTLSATITSSVQSSFGTSEVFNGHKDTDSEGESTSGYSSVARINSKEHVNRSQESSKQTSPAQNCAAPNNNRSLFPTSNATMNHTLFTDKTPSLNMNTSLSSRRPSFNVSTFGSPNFMDKTLATKKILNSPFYSGKTVYGGASAYGRSLGRSAQDLQKNLQNSVRIKPVNQPKDNRDQVLGKTARRILETLEQYSSPINDAKKIPITPKRQAREGAFSKFIGANPYSIKDSRVASNRELQVPTVPELLQMKQKTRLQDSTESVKQIAKTSKSDLNAETYKLRNDDNEKEKHTGKMRTKVASVRQRPQAHEVVSEVNLNPVSLPISTLPKFDLVIPPPAAAIVTTASVTKTTEKPFGAPSSTLFSTASTLPVNCPSSTQNTHTATTVQIEEGTPSALEYHFPKPIVISENLKSVVAYNNFKFSEPICKKAKVDDRPTKVSNSNNTLNFKMPDNKLPTLVPSKSKNNGETIAKPAATLLSTGSVMDVLGKKNDSLLDKFKPAAGSWECSSCMVRNNMDKVRCVACDTPKGKPESKPVSDKWVCNTCLVNNKNDDKQCVACSEPNPFLKPLPVSKVPPASSAGFGTAFKAPSDVWECSTCMIRNKNELSVCAACDTPKSKPEPTKSVAKSVTGAKNSFGATFAMKSDEWECSSCMVRNKSINLKCVSCDTEKPESNNQNAQKDSSNQKSTLKFNFAIDKPAALSFNFGIPAAAAVSQPPSTVSSIFGEQSKATVSSASTTFSFGIPKTEVAKAPEANEINQTTNPLLKPPETAKPATASFTFGITPPVDTSGDTSKENTPKPTVSSSSNVPAPVFNFSPKTSTVFNSKLEGSKMSSTSASPVNMFSFNSKPPTTATPLPYKNALSSEGDKINTGITPLVHANSIGENKKAAPVFSFGKQNNTSPTSNLFKSPELSKPEVSSASKPTENVFVAKVQNDNVMQFGATAALKKDNKSLPTFGSVSKPSDPTASIFNSKPKSESITMFGANSKPTDSATPTGSIPKPTDSFTPFSAPAVQPAESTTSVFGSSMKSVETSSAVFGSGTTNQGFGITGFVNTPLPSLFGDAFSARTEVKPFSFKGSTEKEASVFGSNMKSEETSSAVFGSSTTHQGFAMNGFVNAPVPSLFGNESTRFTATTKIKPFSFKGDSPTEKESPKVTVFSFGASNAASATSQVTSFSFAPSNPTAALTSTVTQSSGFNFTGFNNSTAPASGSNTFSANPPSGTNGIFNFGSANVDAAKVGFAFGAAAAEKLASPGGFNFTTTMTAPSGALNFSGAPPQFDASAKPSFKFTDGSITAFTAQQQTDGEAGKPLRKIKKGIRRMQR